MEIVGGGGRAGRGRVEEKRGLEGDENFESYRFSRHCPLPPSLLPPGRSRPSGQLSRPRSPVVITFSLRQPARLRSGSRPYLSTYPTFLPQGVKLIPALCSRARLTNGTSGTLESRKSRSAARLGVARLGGLRYRL